MLYLARVGSTTFPPLVLTFPPPFPAPLQCRVKLGEPRDHRPRTGRAASHPNPALAALCG